MIFTPWQILLEWSNSFFSLIRLISCFCCHHILVQSNTCLCWLVFTVEGTGSSWIMTAVLSYEPDRACLIWCVLTRMWTEILHFICLHNGMSQLNTVCDLTNLTHSGTSYKFCLAFKCTTIPRIFIVCAVLWGFFFPKPNPTGSLIKRIQPALTQEPDHHTNTTAVPCGPYQPLGLGRLHSIFGIAM